MRLEGWAGHQRRERISGRPELREMVAQVPKVGVEAAPSRRSHLEVRMDMLKAVQAGAKGPTQIMYKANISWVTLREHLRALVEKGFLVENPAGNRRKYALTAKGVEVLDYYFRIEEDMIASIPAKTGPEWLE